MPAAQRPKPLGVASREEARRSRGFRNELLYTGRRSDPETGLQLNRHRFYHQQLGRWVSRDPTEYFAGVYNLYQYVKANPIRYGDPTGETHEEDVDEVIESLRHLCESKNLKCSKKECLAEIAAIAEAYVSMFEEKKRGQLPRLGRNDYRNGWKCYHWQTLTYDAIAPVVSKGKCFDIARVGLIKYMPGSVTTYMLPTGTGIPGPTWTVREPSYRELQHNWVAISADQTCKCSSGADTVYLDPWRGKGPEVFPSVGEVQHKCRLLFTTGPDDKPTGARYTLPKPLPDGKSYFDCDSWHW